MMWFCEECQSWYLRAGCYSRRPGHHSEHYWADRKISEAEKDEAEKQGGRVCYPDSMHRWQLVLNPDLSRILKAA
jgi:hypothetical protein